MSHQAESTGCPLRLCAAGVTCRCEVSQSPNVIAEVISRWHESHPAVGCKRMPVAHMCPRYIMLTSMQHAKKLSHSYVHGHSTTEKCMSVDHFTATGGPESLLCSSAQAMIAAHSRDVCRRLPCLQSSRAAAQDHSVAVKRSTFRCRHMKFATGHWHVHGTDVAVVNDSCLSRPDKTSPARNATLKCAGDRLHTTSSKPASIRPYP